jgi:DNA-binding protein HU-beta
MYKTDLIKRVARETRLSQRVVSDVIAASHGLIEQALREGQTVTFPGFGTFYTRDKAEGQVRDVRTGEMVSYAARKVAAFRVGDVLKRAVGGQRRTSKGRARQPRSQ